MVQLGLAKLQQVLEGKRLALMMNHSAMDNNGRNLIDVICTDWKCNVEFLFAMEHGMRGNMTSGFHHLDGAEEKTGVRIECLYKFPKSRPPVELVETVDAVVFSAMDAGSRCYTYAPWMCYLIAAAAQADREVIVVDRPDPLDGMTLEGGLMGSDYFGGLLGEFPYPLRHGLTIGEMAQMYNATLPKPAKLTVVPMEGYRRDMLFAETGCPWTPPSPAIPTPETLLVYTGMVFFDHAKVSVGRGTAAPFYYCGAPYVDAEWLTDRMNSLALPGVRCVESYWQPQFAAYKDEICAGIYINVTDQRAFKSAELAVRLAFALTERYPEEIGWSVNGLNKRSGSTLLSDALLGHNPSTPDSILETWRQECEAFAEARKPYLLY